MSAVSKCHRNDARTNMFVLATISWSGVSNPVRVRNMSAAGALVEGATLPPAGAAVLLRRGQSVAAGRVVWHEGGKAGLIFDKSATVAEWMPGDRTGQEQVDQIVHHIRSGELTAAPLRVTSVPLISSSELRSLADGLCNLADELSNDMTLVVRHSHGLQLLDIAAQTLRKIAASR